MEEETKRKLEVNMAGNCKLTEDSVYDMDPRRLRQGYMGVRLAENMYSSMYSEVPNGAIEVSTR